MKLIKIVTVECIHLDELFRYNKPIAIMDRASRDLFVDYIIGTIINNIVRDLYYEPIPLSVDDISDCYFALNIMIDSDTDLQSTLRLMNRIKDEMMLVVINDCSISNTTTETVIIANRFLNIYIYDISPIQTYG